MLFDIKQFEQVFKESALKKGLKLFEKGAVEFAGREVGSGFHFRAGGEALYLKKRGDKLISYSCSCMQDNYCSHLAAVMFYFQQEALGISAGQKTRSRKKAQEEGASVPGNLVKREKEQLVRMIKQSRNDLPAEQVAAFLLSSRTLGLAEVYQSRLDYFLEPYIQLKKLDEPALAALCDALSAFVKRIKADLKKQGQFYFDHALLRAFIPLFNLRYTGNERTLFKFYDQALERLSFAFEQGLSSVEKTCWYRTTLISVESNKSLQSYAFLFLVPRFLSWVRNAGEIAALGRRLEKRSLKLPYTQQLDKLQIARLEVAVKEKELFKTEGILKDAKEQPELSVARAELYFCAGHADKAFKQLSEDYTRIQQSVGKYYNEYLSYVISAAGLYNRPDLELHYLREALLYRMFISPAELVRYLELLPAKLQRQEIMGLAVRLKELAGAAAFDKLSVLFLKAGLTEELIQELEFQHGKFHLLHETAFKRIPGNRRRFYSLYIRHLSENMKRDGVYNHQLKLLAIARELLDRLPQELRAELIVELLEHLGRSAQIARHIRQLYGLLLPED